MSEQLSQNHIILMREQVSENTDPIDTGLNNNENFTAQENIDFSIDLDAINDSVDRKNWSADGTKRTFVKNMAEFEIEIPFTRGVSGSDNQPYYHPIWKAANFEEELATPAAGETRYTPSTENVSWLTAYQYIRNARDSQSRLRYFTDGHLSGEISLTSGEETTMSLSGTCFYNTITKPRNYIDSGGGIDFDKDGTAVTAAIGTVADHTPLVPKNLTLKLSSPAIGSNIQEFEISDLNIDLAWTQDTIDAMTNSPGVMPNFNTRSAGEGITGSFTLQEASPTDFDNLIAAYENGEEIEIFAELKDTSGATRVELTMPNCQFSPESEGENGNLMSHEFDFVANRDLDADILGDNSLQIVYK